MPRFRHRLPAALCLAAIGACALSESDEVALGRESAAEIDAQLPLVGDPAVTGYVTDLGLALAQHTARADLDWRFRVVNSSEPNAFAVPGGFIYLNRGLIERMDGLDQLAGVLGHEIGHVALRHSVDQMKKAGRANVGVAVVCTLSGWCDGAAARVALDVAGSAWFARHSRADEAEADSAAVVALVRAGIDPGGVPALFELLLAERQREPLAVEALFASHPLEEARVDRTRAQIDALHPALLDGLVQDTPAFHEFKARLAALPPPPPPAQLPR